MNRGQNTYENKAPIFQNARIAKETLENIEHVSKR